MNTATLFSMLIGVAVLCIYVGQVAAAARADKNVDCPEADSLVPHWNCSLYYQCSNFVPILVECSIGLYFNSRINQCDFPSNVPECIAGTNRPPDGELTTPIPPVPTSEQPATTVEDPGTTESSDRPTPITGAPSDPPNPSTPDSICPPDGVINFPYPGNCSLYIQCIFGTPIIQQCAEGLLFDHIDLICKPAADAVCDDGEPGTTTTEVPPEFECPPSGVDTFPHASNCSLYYLCFNGQLATESCTFGLYYDAAPTVKQCNNAEAAMCDSECPADGIHYRPIRTARCEYYKVCFSGQSANLKCADGTLYHPGEERCVGLDAYTCPYGG